MEKAEARTFGRKAAPEDSKVALECSQQVCRRIFQTESFRSAHRVGIYWALKWEIDLRPLWLLAPEKCLFPKTLPNFSLAFYSVDSLEKFQPRGNLMEPIAPPDHPETQWQSHDLILVPGLCFDAYGGRVGSGQGYYDRFLAKNPLAQPWGVCFSSQKTKKRLVQDKTDVRMCCVVTELEIANCERT